LKETVIFNPVDLFLQALIRLLLGLVDVLGNGTELPHL
jgi:hypothetical protein